MVNYRAFGIAAVALIGLLTLAGCPVAKQSTGGNDVAGNQPQPVKRAGSWSGDVQDFNFKMFDGKPGKLSDYAGQPIVVNFFAAWCGPCMRELPEMQEVYNSHQGKFVFLSVAVNEDSNPKQVVADKGFNWKFAVDKGGADLYNVNAIPTTLFVDRKGNIVKRVLGPMTREAFETNLLQIL